METELKKVYALARQAIEKYEAQNMIADVLFWSQIINTIEKITNTYEK